MMCRPRLRSRKNTGSSCCQREHEFASDRFFDFRRIALVVLRQLVHGLASPVTFCDKLGGNSGAPDDRPSSGECGIDDHRRRRVLRSGPCVRIEPDGHALGIALNPTQGGVNDFTHGHLARLADVGQVTVLFGEQIQAIRLHFSAEQSPQELERRRRSVACENCRGR